ncbi:MAG TPA: DUF1587 domain-containing protein, partial [Isosphaeraceae bacterium]|nr:DUF1587 domain-containing protein [Isosphaeraceae bacterium]
MRNASGFWCWERKGFLVVCTLMMTPYCWAESPNMGELGPEFSKFARPVVEEFCLSCHSAELKSGDLDLERFKTLNDVRQAVEVWVKVAEKLDNGEMPPEKAGPMPAGDRQTLGNWLKSYLRAEAAETAGDPGPVVLRRLSNAQYTYTLQDLTGLPIEPAREFPVDGAAGEGFTNTGSALVMSPGLLAKYFDAAKGVAEHVVFLPAGLRFSPGTTRRDWTNEIVDEIRAFYAQFTSPGSGTKVNLQGIVFDTNAGGRLPLEAYFEATLVERSALEIGRKTVEQVAQESQLSPKYLGLLWSLLNGSEPSPLVDDLRTAWKQAEV